MRQTTRWIAVVGLLVVVGCSTPLKQRVSTYHQIVRESLVAVDEAERALCGPDPAVPTHCTNPAAQASGLTDAKHQQFSRHLVEAFREDIRAGIVIIAWESGTPMPDSLPALLTSVEGVLGGLDGVVNPDLLEKARTVLEQVQALMRLLGGVS